MFLCRLEQINLTKIKKKNNCAYHQGLETLVTLDVSQEHYQPHLCCHHSLPLMTSDVCSRRLFGYTPHKLDTT